MPCLLSINLFFKNYIQLKKRPRIGRSSVGRSPTRSSDDPVKVVGSHLIQLPQEWGEHWEGGGVYTAQD